MQLSTRTRYGTRAMVELASAYPGRLVPLQEVAKTQGLSVKYLEQIMRILKVGGLIMAARGKRGGYRLTRSPEDIKLTEVYRVLEGPTALAPCLDGAKSCPMRESCPTRETWIEIREAIEGVLERSTLQDLVDRKISKSQARSAVVAAF
jgi:Rrf2 family protein